MKKIVKYQPYATIYDPTSNGIAHCCINYSEHSRYYGAMLIIKCKLEAVNMPIFDITNTSKIIGLDATNIVKYGGKQIKS